MLDTATAEAAIVALLDDLAARTDNPAQARRDFARDLVAAVAALLRTATFLPATAPVTTAGTAAAQTGTANLAAVRLT